MDDILKNTLLYDFYGELLTEKQKSIYKNYYLDDLSLKEISDNFSISRQAVYDSIKRVQKIMLEYEEKLCLIKKYGHNNSIYKKILNNLDIISSNTDNDLIQNSVRDIKLCINEIIDD